jgi:predicted O-methyltransferase YrrM
MTQRTLAIDDRLHAYLLESGLREHPAQRRLREETDRLPDASMRSSAEQVALLQLLIELLEAKRVLEVGCFTGYGTLGMALALPADGRLTTFDVNERWAGIGRRYWREAGVEDRIDLRLGLALDSLDALLAGGQTGAFDLVYVDADKKTYDAYYERALALVRPGGIVALDNVLWNGSVADPEDRGRQTEALRTLNAKIRDDGRVSMCLAPIGDGLMLARKRV